MVIAIIATLAGLVAAGWPGIQTTIRRNNCETQLQELSRAINAYQLDNGIYPKNPTSEPPEEGAHVLYIELSGDTDGDGEVDEDAKIYTEDLDFNKSVNQNTNVVKRDGQGRIVVLDPFGSLIRYHADPPNKRPIQTRNPTFDIWSLGGAEPGSTDPKDLSKWITNWD